MKKNILCIFILAAILSGCSSLATTIPVENTTSITEIALPTNSPTIELPTSTPLPSPTPGPELGTIALDFIAQVCDAEWMNGGQHLTPCPNVNADHSGGYAVKLDPLLEGLPAGTPVLLTIPATNGFAALFLRYPPITIHKGDHFRATLRCQSNAACDVQFAIEFFDLNGNYSGPFLSWNYKSGDPEIKVDADLSAIAGQTVKLTLTLRPQNDHPELDQSLWIAPYIFRQIP
jgi:hypothetical protein